MQHVENIHYVYLLNKYIKCSIWRLAVRYDPLVAVRRQMVNRLLIIVKWQRRKSNFNS